MTEEVEAIKYVDKVITLANGSTLVGRLLTDEKYASDNLVAVYRPMEVTHNSEDMFLRQWIAASSDIVYFIPISLILNVANPSAVFIDAYTQIVTDDSTIPTQEEEDVQSDIDRSKMH